MASFRARRSPGRPRNHRILALLIAVAGQVAAPAAQAWHEKSHAHCDDSAYSCDVAAHGLVAHDGKAAEGSPEDPSLCSLCQTFCKSKQLLASASETGDVVDLVVRRPATLDATESGSDAYSSSAPRAPPHRS